MRKPAYYAACTASGRLILHPPGPFYFHDRMGVWWGGKAYIPLTNLVSNHGNKEPEHTLLRGRVQGVVRSEGQIRHDLEGVCGGRIQSTEESQGIGKLDLADDCRRLLKRGNTKW